MKPFFTKSYLFIGICFAFCGSLSGKDHSKPIKLTQRLLDDRVALSDNVKLEAKKTETHRDVYKPSENAAVDRIIGKGAEKFLPGPIGFSTQPQDQTACEGYTATFTATYSASTTFKWQQSDDLAFTSPTDLTTGGAYQINSTSTSSTLQIVSAFSLSGKYYRCVADPSGSPVPSESRTLTVVPLTTISYGASPLIISSGDANVTLSGTAGGVFSASPAGLIIDASTGAINTNTSARGAYQITYIVAAPAACPAYVVPKVAVKLQTTTRTFTWTGASSDDWHTLGNWLENSTIPAVFPSEGSQTGDDVIIPTNGSERYPLITSTAKARSITIASGAKLDIATTGNLSVVASGTDGITNNGKLTNEGTVIIDSSYNDGFVNKTGASLINKKTLTISKGTGSRLKNSSWVENFSSSTITINGGLETSVINYNNATIKNLGTFTINNGQKGALYNEGTVNNLSSFSAKGGAQGSVVVNMDTLSNQAGATFGIASGNVTSLDNANYWYNAGTFTVTGTNNTDDTPGVINRENAKFINTSTANTTFSSSGYSALIFKNEGYLESSSALTIQNSGKGLLVNTVKGEIVNNAVLTLSNCTTDAFTNFGKFTNNATGTLTISSNGGSNYQINNSGTIKSAIGCTFNFNNGNRGILNNNNGNFNNKCITSFGPKGSALVDNSGTYIHDEGSIALNGGTTYFFDNKDTAEINVPIAINFSLGKLINNSGIFTMGVKTIFSVNNGSHTDLMITNLSTGTLNSSATFSHNFCSGIINNQGVMTLGAGSKITAHSIGSPIINTGSLTNEGMLSFRSFSDYAVNNSGTFKNKGSLAFSNSGKGIRNWNGATMENSGVMKIDSVFGNGILQETGSNGFTNTVSGKISINFILANGILNSAGTFTNNGQLLIANVDTIGLSGIANAATFLNAGLVRIGDAGKINLNALSNTGTLTNADGGKFYLKNSFGSGVDNQGGTIENQACAAIESVPPVVNSSGTFTNAGLIHKLIDNRTATSNIGANTGTVINDDPDAFTYSGVNGALPPAIEITSSNGILYTGETRTLTATPSGGIFGVSGPATVDGNTLTATGIGTIVVSYTIVGGDNCTYAATQFILPLTIAKITRVLPGCKEATGSITVTPGGVGTFEYSKGGGIWQSSPIFTELASGSYTISARSVATPDYVTTYKGNPVQMVNYSPVTSAVVPTGDITTSLTCQTEDGWTFYTNEEGTQTYFGVKWNGNEAAKNAAILTLKTTDQVSSTQTSGSAKGSFTMPRYWNIDVGANTLTNPVSVTFSYLQAEKDKVIADAAQFAADNSKAASDFVWFKTTNVAYDPAVHLLATGISGNPIELTGSESTVNAIRQVVFTGITSFSGGTGAVGVGLGSALPVTLFSFSGKSVENYINLSWKTTSELNAHSFEIQRSFNAKNFERIGQLRAIGTTSDLSVYEFNDSLPMPGLNYYRLKQLDLDGTFAFSKIISVTWEGSNALVIYPNPATEQIELELPQSSVIREIVIIAESGSVIKKIKQPGRIVNVRSLANGSYFMKIVTTNKVFTQKFVKITK